MFEIHGFENLKENDPQSLFTIFFSKDLKIISLIKTELSLFLLQLFVFGYSMVFRN